eukprot:TRINITY_DN3855_c0_g1_i1.p1 TRINITY_DN3855_c0_g1~~TRINITY_DN3855_c0_g1_i1.p1  ORF type:complete len:1439 (+),score=481.93 TRINITY_DN3855_c0_g1_i1:70-4386(+)
MQRLVVCALLAAACGAAEGRDGKETAESTGPKKVSVLGTGLGSMAAVFYMTNYEGWEKDWDIDVYQMGWRMGGKAASGRTMNDESGSRILEHGLHIFFAGYFNAFGLVTDLYKEWRRPKDHPIQKVSDAFHVSCNSDIFADMKGLGQPNDWSIINQENPLRDAWQCLYTDEAIPKDYERVPTPLGNFRSILIGLNKTAPPEIQGGMKPVMDAVALLERPPNATQRDHLLGLLRPLQEVVNAKWRKVESSPVDDYPGQVWPPPMWCNAGKTNLPATHKSCSTFFWRATVMEIAVVVGFLADDVMLNGCGKEPLASESIDRFVCRHKGPCDLEHDDLLRALPFAALFAFQNGDVSKPNFSVAALFCGLMGFGDSNVFRKSGLFNPGIVFRMQAGMGEIIMTPAYEVLKARGVKFHFFHKVEALRTSDGETVDAIDIDVQATVLAGETSYNPLFNVKGLDVWPDLSHPATCDGCSQFFDQLGEAKDIIAGDVNLESYYSGWKGARQKRLVKGADFDIVINGITSGALPYVTQDLMAANAEWKYFVETTTTVATVGLQVWTYNTTAELGYTVPEIDPEDLSRTEIMAAGGPEPYDTWADMTHLAKYETSNPAATAGAPQSVQYWCSPIMLDTSPGAANFSDRGFPKRQMERAYDAGVEWLEQYTDVIMPEWSKQLYDSMVAPPSVTGRDRLRRQYFRTNFEPTEQYVQTPAGSLQGRPVPWPLPWSKGDVFPYKNMGVAGDHSLNGIDFGCAEAATLSGVVLAHAITAGKGISRYTGFGLKQHHLLPELGDYYPLVGEEFTKGSPPTSAKVGAEKVQPVKKHDAAVKDVAPCPYAPPQGGTLVADVIPVSLPRAAVIKMLPKEVALAPELDALADIPVTFAFGHQLTCNNAPDAWLDGRAYNLSFSEVSVTVPAVKFSKPKKGQSTASFSFVPRTYLDNELAMVIGWALSAVDKDQAHIRSTQDASGTRRWEISDFDKNNTLLAMQATSNGSAWTPFSALPKDALARSVVPDFLQASLLGNAQGPPGIPEMFPMCVDRGATLGMAKVQAINGSMTVMAGVDILPAMTQTFTPANAFRLMVNYTAGLPYNCSADFHQPSPTHAADAVLATLPKAQLRAPAAGPSDRAKLRGTTVQEGTATCTHPPGAGGGGGAYLADFVISLVSTKEVEALLPQGTQLPLALRLVPVTPVMFVFGYQYGVCDNSAFKPWLDGRAFVMDYNEFIMAVPAVEMKTPGLAQVSRTYQPRLFLDHPVPMALGWGFGINKVLAHFERDAHAGTWAVKDWNTQEALLTTKTVNVTGFLPIPSYAADSRVGMMAKAVGGDGGFPTEILGLSGRGYKGDAHGQGYFVCGVFSWDFLDHAEAQLIAGDMKMHRSVDDFNAVKPFETPFIGMRVRTNWTMSFPDDCTHSAAAKTDGSDPNTDAWVKLRDALLADRQKDAKGVY